MRIVIGKCFLCVVSCLIALTVSATLALASQQIEIELNEGSTPLAVSLSTTPALTFVQPNTDAPFAITLTEEEPSESFPIVISNTSDYSGELSVELLIDGASQQAKTDPDSLVAVPNGVATAEITVTLDGLEPGSSEAVLTVRGTEAGAPLPATLPVTVSKAGEPEANWSEVTVSPETTTMIVTNRIPSVIDSRTEKWILGLSGVLLLVLVLFRRPLGRLVKLDETDFGSGQKPCPTHELTRSEQVAEWKANVTDWTNNVQRTEPDLARAMDSLRSQLATWLPGSGTASSDKSSSASLADPTAPQTRLSKLFRHSFVVVPVLVALSLIVAALLVSENGFVRSGDMADVRLYGANEPAIDDLSATPISDALLSDSHGEEATVVLTNAQPAKDFKDGDPFYLASVQLEESSGPGSFEGDIRTDPDDPKSAKVKVNLTVRDWWYWPLLAALFGTWIGWLITNGYEQRRSREMIRKTLKETEESYKRTKTSIGPDSKFVDLLECQSQPARSEEQALEHRLTTVKSKINTATNKEELDNAATSAVEIQNYVALWPEICRVGTNLATLRKTMEEALEGMDPRVLKLQPLLARCNRLLDPYDRAPGSSSDGDPPDTAPLGLAKASDIEKRIAEISAASEALLVLLRAIQLTQVAEIYYQQFATSKPSLDPNLMLIARLSSAVDLDSANALVTSVLDNFDAIMDETGTENQLLGVLSRYLSGRILPTDESILTFLVNRLPADDPNLPVLRRYRLSSSHLLALQELRTTDLLTVEQKRLIENLMTHRVDASTGPEIDTLLQTGQKWLQEHHRQALKAFNGSWQLMVADREALVKIITPPTQPLGEAESTGTVAVSSFLDKEMGLELAGMIAGIQGTAGGTVSPLGTALSELILPGAAPQLLSSVQMVSRIRTTDMLIGGAAIMLGAIIWLLAEYGENAAYGRPAQYLGVIATTTAISTLLGNAILPWARSYRLKAPSAAVAPASDTAG